MCGASCFTGLAVPGERDCGFMFWLRPFSSLSGRFRRLPSLPCPYCAHVCIADVLATKGRVDRSRRKEQAMPANDSLLSLGGGCRRWRRKSIEIRNLYEMFGIFLNLISLKIEYETIVNSNNTNMKYSDIDWEAIKRNILWGYKVLWFDGSCCKA